jgi:hypothetical protein
MKRSRTKCGLGLLSLFLFTATMAVGGYALRANTVPSVSQASAERRIALVIGNNKYPKAVLNNPTNDATDVAAVLKEYGFQVDLRTDVSLEAMNKAVDEFVNRLGYDTVGLFYFAGHGRQINGENYLIPVDFDETKPAFSASALEERMENSRGSLNIIILDACRNNPFGLRSGTRSGDRGLAHMSPVGRGIVIVFATSPGCTASENWKERNGLFTKYLLKSLQENPCLEEVLSNTRQCVSANSGPTLGSGADRCQRQIPEIDTLMSGQFCFRNAHLVSSYGPVCKTEVGPPPPPPPPCEGIKPPDAMSFSLESTYEASGIMGDVDDVRINKQQNMVRFTYTPTGKGHHEWDYKYIDGELNPQPAGFGGVMYLNPANNFGTVCGGYDLTGMHVIRWKARSVGRDANVEFRVGGVKWKWDEHKGKVEPPFPDSMPGMSLGVKTLPKDKLMEFEYKLPNHSDETYLKRVVNAFSWVLSWGSNDVEPRDNDPAPKKFIIEIKDISYSVK